jgi:hypothetical protein
MATQEEASVEVRRNELTRIEVNGDDVHTIRVKDHE